MLYGYVVFSSFIPDYIFIHNIYVFAIVNHIAYALSNAISLVAIYVKIFVYKHYMSEISFK